MQTLKEAIRLVESGNTHMVRAATALNGCPVGGWGETTQAWNQMTDYLPRKDRRAYTARDFVIAVYDVTLSDRYSSKYLPYNSV